MAFTLRFASLDLIGGLGGDGVAQDSQGSSGLQSANIVFGGAFKIEQPVEGFGDSRPDDQNAMITHDHNLNRGAIEQGGTAGTFGFEGEAAEIMIDDGSVIEHRAILIDRR